MIFHHDKKKLRLVKLLTLFGLVLLSCVNGNEALKLRLIKLSQTEDFVALEGLSDAKLKKIVKLNDGSLYYLSLRLQDSDYINKTETTKRLLSYGLKYYSKPYKQACEKLFLELASIDEKIQFLENKQSQLLEELQVVKKQKNISDAESIKTKIDLDLEIIEVQLNELYLLSANLEKLSDPLEIYIAKIKLSKKSALILQTYFIENNFDQNDITENPFSFYSITQARILCTMQNYRASAELILNILSEVINTDSSTLSQILTRPIISDFGRATLLGAKDVPKAINLLSTLYSKILNNLSEPFSEDQLSALHALTFYIARLYEKLPSRFFDEVIKYYELATKFAPNSADYDNALWYELKFLSTNEKVYLVKLKETAPSWKNAYWYEDLVATLSLKYTQNQSLEKLKLLLSIISPTNLNEEKAKLNYAIGRLTDSDTEIQNTFNLQQDNFYYKLMSAYRLKKDAIFKFEKQYKRQSDLNPNEAFTLMVGLETFELYEHMYKHIKTFAQNIRVTDAELFSKSLYDNGFYADSINLIQYATRSENAILSTSALKLLYPRPFYDIVSKYAREYKIPEYFIYALMRCESFFRVGVSSHAGAVGLCQLMPATADGIAKYFKLDNYDITDPETNIRFGVFYLSDMIRVQGVYVKAFQAYNAGGGNVRKWNRKYGKLANDIFVEMTPFAETRNYAKKILQAACHYAMLYYDVPFEKVIAEFFDF